MALPPNADPNRTDSGAARSLAASGSIPITPCPRHAQEAHDPSRPVPGVRTSILGLASYVFAVVMPYSVFNKPGMVPLLCGILILVALNDETVKLRAVEKQLQEASAGLGNHSSQ